jgi:M6 family metalloprotease-like protein
MRKFSTGAQGKKNLPVLATSTVIATICFLLILSSASAQGRGSNSSSPHESERAAQVRTLNNSVLQLHGQIQENASNAAAIRGQAATVFAQRAATLQALIQEDPHAALTFAFSPELLADLKAKFPESAKQLESHATLSGPIDHWVFDNADLKSSRSVYQMKVGNDTFNLYFAGAEPPVVKGAYTLRATGVLAGHTMAVSASDTVPAGAALALASAPNGKNVFGDPRFLGGHSGPLFIVLAAFVLVLLGSAGRMLHALGTTRQIAACIAAIAMFAFNPGIVSAQSSVCSTTGTQNMAVLLVNFQDSAIAVTPQQASDIFFDTSTGHSLNGYWQEASYGHTSATGNVFGPFTVGPTSSYTCLTMSQLFSDAVVAASASGVNLQNYTRINVVFPGLSCGWAGVTSTGSAGAGCSTWNTPSGTLTASLSYLISSYLTTRDKGVILAAHENGHQLGLDHAGTITDEPTAVLGPPSDPGTVGDFNDFFSVMGAWTLATYSAQHKSEILNWMASGANYQIVQSSGTYTLQPIEMNPPGLQGLKVQRGTSNLGDYLWIEYRQPIGNYDSTIGFMNFAGALVHYQDSTTGKHTHVLDFNASDVGSWYNTVLGAGQSWTDPYSNVSISVQGATASGLTVNVSYGGASCTASAPSLSVSPLDPSIYPGQSANYTVAVTNNDSSACASSTINLASTEPAGWSTSLSTSSVTLSPGQSTSVTMGKGAPSGTPAGTYAVSLNASNNSAGAVGNANVTVMTAPSLAVSVSVAGTSFSRPGTVPVAASVTSGGAPLSGASVTFTITTPNGNTATQTATTGSSGTATWNYKLNQKSPVGTYSVSAQAGQGSSSGSRKSLSTQTVAGNTVTFVVQ